MLPELLALVAVAVMLSGALFYVLWQGRRRVHEKQWERRRESIVAQLAGGRPAEGIEIEYPPLPVRLADSGANRIPPGKDGGREWQREPDRSARLSGT